MRYLVMMLAMMVALSACSDANSGGDEAEGDSTAVEQNSMSGNGELITTPSGVEVLIQRPGDGVKPQMGNQVIVNYVGMLSDGKVFDQSAPGQPMKFILGSGQGMPGWHTGIAELSAGAAAKITIPADQGFGAEGLGNLIPPNEQLTFDVEVLEVKEGPKPIAHEQFDTKGKKKQTTDSGLEYYIIEEGTGAPAAAGKTVSVHYYGALENGTKFDASYERGEPIEFQLGSGQVIPGWEEGISLLKEGSKAQLIIPPHLAYGESGAGAAIPPNATLIFDVELVEVK